MPFIAILLADWLASIDSSLLGWINKIKLKSKQVVLSYDEKDFFITVVCSASICVR